MAHAASFRDKLGVNGSSACPSPTLSSKVPKTSPTESSTPSVTSPVPSPNTSDGGQDGLGLRRMVGEAVCSCDNAVIEAAKTVEAGSTYHA